MGEPAAATDRFVRLPDGTRLYRTGDVGWWDRTGDLVVSGRRDQQVKVRGYRVEPEGVEAVLLDAPEVREAAVLARSGRLAAVVVGPAPQDLDAVRAHLRDQLPDYMVPERLTIVDRIPRVANGKIDRDALERLIPSAATPRGNQDFAPDGPEGRVLATLWTELLEQAPAGGGEDFFDAGGDSLLAVQLVNRFEREIGARVPLRTLLADATFDGILAAALQLKG